MGSFGSAGLVLWVSAQNWAWRLRHERGQTTTELALLIAAMAFVIPAIVVLWEGLQAMFESTAEDIEYQPPPYQPPPMPSPSPTP